MYDTQFMGQSVYCSVWPTVREEQMLIITLGQGSRERFFVRPMPQLCEGRGNWLLLSFICSQLV